MLPIITIIIIAIVGAVAYGVAGFFLFGIGGYIAVTVFGVLLHKFRRGFVPAKVRRQTASDFFAAHRALVAQAFPGMPETACVEEVSKLIEEMVDHVAMQTPATAGVSETLSYGVFLPLASEVAAKQPTAQRREMADELVGFLEQHELWFGR